MDDTSDAMFRRTIVLCLLSGSCVMTHQNGIFLGVVHPGEGL